MDLVLETCDYFLFDKVYATLLPNKLNTTHIEYGNKPLPLTGLYKQFESFQQKDEVYGMPKLLPASPDTYGSAFPRTNLVRQTISIYLVTCLFGWLLYFSVASASYLTVFDKKIFNHPRYLKNQMSLEIRAALRSIPTMVLLTVPFFLLELNGYSRLYGSLDDVFSEPKRSIWQAFTFIMFTDCGIYFIHRWLHIPAVYKRLHKPHHKWIVCTPFASHAFHPVDGWAQALPYHLYPLLFPLHKVLYLVLFTFVNFWTVMIHDGQYMSNDPVVNGTACHTVHHLYFNYNYGQFTTLWDRIGRSYRRPDDSFFVKADENEEKKEWVNQVKGMEAIRNVLEGKDERTYN